MFSTKQTNKQTKNNTKTKQTNKQTQPPPPPNKQTNKKTKPLSSSHSDHRSDMKEYCTRHSVEPVSWSCTTGTTIFTLVIPQVIINMDATDQCYMFNVVPLRGFWAVFYEPMICGLQENCWWPPTCHFCVTFSFKSRLPLKESTKCRYLLQEDNCWMVA